MDVMPAGLWLRGGGGAVPAGGHEVGQRVIEEFLCANDQGIGIQCRGAFETGGGIVPNPSDGVHQYARQNSWTLQSLELQV